MKRLLQIGSSTLAMSLMPILSWFLLGVTLDANLINVFSLTYPICFLSQVLVSIFAVGANIKKEKENNQNSVLSGMLLGFVAGAVLLAILLVNVDNYINFMSVDIAIYKTFTIYSFVYSFISLIFMLVLQKYYFEGKEKRANIHSICFNVLTFVCLIGLSLITKNQIVIIAITLAVMGIYATIFFVKQFKKFKLEFNILSNIKYESSEIVCCLLLFATYFIGYSNSFAVGEEYLVALSFVGLITDAQWDCCEAISTCAKIDVARGEYNYKQTRKNAYIYSLILLSTYFIAFFALFRLYNVNLKIGLTYLVVESVLYVFNPIDYGFEPYVQIEFSAGVNTARSVISNIIRFLCSIILPTAFCTQIGMVASSLFSVAVLLFIKLKYFKQEKTGKLTKKVLK